ncbi:MAG: hypothetical protein AAB250_09945, partial [Bdellovibrionota bacterium]
MRTWILSFAVCFAFHAQGQETMSDVTLQAPSSTATTEEMQLIQNSPAMEASAIVAPLMRETFSDVASPRV